MRTHGTGACVVALLLGAIAVEGGCSSPKEPAAPRTLAAAAPAADWSIFVYMNAKNNLERDAFGNFAQIANVDLGPTVNVIVEFGRPKTHYYDGPEKWSGVLEYHMRRGIRPVAADSDCGQPDCTAATPRDLDMGAQQTLADFVSSARARYPAKHYAVVIWDHGQGWRLQAAPNRQDKIKALGVERLLAPPGHTPAIGSFRSASYDEDTGHTMFNRYIEDALRPAAGQPKLDVVGFDACLMSMAETAYALRDVADLLVGSEELEPGPGWNYDRWLTSVVAHVPATGVALAQTMVEAYRLEYGDRNPTTLSALQVGQAPALAAALTDLSKALLAGLDSNRTSIQNARAKCGPYGKQDNLKSSIDAVCVLHAIAAADGRTTVRTAAAQAATVAAAMVAANYASKVEAPLGSNGVAIFFPASKADFTADPDHDGYTRQNRDAVVEFVTDCDWPLFLSKYLRIN